MGNLLVSNGKTSLKREERVENDGIISSLINDKFDIVKERINWDEGLQDKVSNLVVQDLCISKYREEYHRSRVDVMVELGSFLDRRYSKVTSSNYKRWIGVFLDWCKEIGVDCLDISPKEVDSYLVYLMNKYESTNTVRSMVLGVSSFYSYMSIRYPEVFKVNPFYKVKLPKVKLTRRIDVVSSKDIEVVIKELEKIGRKEIGLCVKLMSKYGFRVGSFERMTISDKGVYTSESKCSSITGKFTSKEVKEIKEYGVLGLNGHIITLVVNRLTNKLFKDGMISCPFSPHDLRHYCITKEIKDMNCDKLIQVSRKFHKNINTTLGYFNG